MTLHESVLKKHQAPSELLNRPYLMTTAWKRLSQLVGSWYGPEGAPHASVSNFIASCGNYGVISHLRHIQCRLIVQAQELAKHPSRRMHYRCYVSTVWCAARFTRPYA